jgi:hypothetical protein
MRLAEQGVAVSAKHANEVARLRLGYPGLLRQFSRKPVALRHAGGLVVVVAHGELSLLTLASKHKLKPNGGTRNSFRLFSVLLY